MEVGAVGAVGVVGAGNIRCGVSMFVLFLTLFYVSCLLFLETHDT